MTLKGVKILVTMPLISLKITGLRFGEAGRNGETGNPYWFCTKMRWRP